MEPLIWIVIAVALGIAEIFTTGFFFLFFPVGAVVAAIASFLTPDINIQMSCFLTFSGLSLFFARPILKKNFQVGEENLKPSNVNRLLGAEVLVLETVTRYGGKVKVLNTGEVWSAYIDARAGGAAQELPEGREAKVSSVDGAKLVVSAKEEVGEPRP